MCYYEQLYCKNNIIVIKDAINILLLNLETNETKIINLHNSEKNKNRFVVNHDNLLIINENRISIYNLCICQFMCSLKNEIGEIDIHLYDKYIARICKNEIVQIFTG